VCTVFAARLLARRDHGLRAALPVVPRYATTKAAKTILGIHQTFKHLHTPSYDVKSDRAWMQRQSSGFPRMMMSEVASRLYRLYFCALQAHLTVDMRARQTPATAAKLHQHAAMMVVIHL